MSGVQVVPHDRTDTPTPPAVDLSMSPSSRHTPSSPEMTNGNYVPSGVSMTDIYTPMQTFHRRFNQLLCVMYPCFLVSALCCWKNKHSGSVQSQHSSLWLILLESIWNSIELCHTLDKGIRLYKGWEACVCVREDGGSYQTPLVSSTSASVCSTCSQWSHCRGVWVCVCGF